MRGQDQSGQAHDTDAGDCDADTASIATRKSDKRSKKQETETGGKRLTGLRRKLAGRSPEGVIEAARLMLTDMVGEFVWDKHWERKQKKKEFDGKIGSIRAAARRVGSIVRNDEARVLSV